LPIEVGIILSTAEGKVESSDALREHCSRGDLVHATLIQDLDRMSLEQIAEELALDDNEFKGHSFTLSKMPSGSTARYVADYLWSNQILMTSQQALALFDMLLTKVNVVEGSSWNVRAQLIVALHSFCVHQHHIWEPNDGMDECLWANMTWSARHLPLEKRMLTKGKLECWVSPDAASASSTDAWLVEDVCCLKEVASARRVGKEEPLQEIKFVVEYGKTWRNIR